MRLPEGLLYHRVDIRQVLEIPQPDGTTFGAWQTGIPALVAMNEELVVDQRVTLESYGAEILSHTNVLMQPETLPTVGSQIRTYPGTAQERIATVARTAYLEHDIAPEYGQAWLV